jgi:hypothetical protein
MFLDEESEELADKRIKQTLEHDTSTSVPVRIVKKLISNTIKF